MKRSCFFLAGILFSAAAFLCNGFAQGGRMVIDDFESGLGPRWEKKVFKGETEYSIVETAGNHSLKAKSHAAASGLVYKISYESKEYPLLTWRWKVGHVLEKGDAATREGDDYPARIYVIFPHFIPTLTRSINYIWANKLPKGSRVPNAYYSKAVMVAVESGEENCGRWVMETRNVYEDYEDIFGKPPPKVGAIAIMTDTDNTSESAVACYDDIQISK